MAKTLHGIYDMPMFVSGDVLLYGLSTAHITVRSGGRLVVHGIITANLIVENQGTAIVHGMVTGTTFNRGGSLEIYGTIENLDDDGTGSTIISPKASVHRPAGRLSAL